MGTLSGASLLRGLAAALLVYRCCDSDSLAVMQQGVDEVRDHADGAGFCRGGHGLAGLKRVEELLQYVAHVRRQQRIARVQRWRRLLDPLQLHCTVLLRPAKQPSDNSQHAQP